VTREDGPAESMTAAMFFVASIFFFVLSGLYANCGWSLVGRNVFFLLLAVLFFVGAGEELSWGQRVFGMETPAFLSGINAQNEINIHNLYVFDLHNRDGTPKTFLSKFVTSGYLFNLFWFAYCVCVPIVTRLSPALRTRVARIGVPIVPLWLGLLFVVNFGALKVLRLEFVSNIPRDSVTELFECNSALLFFILSLHLLLNRSRQSDA
jgi:hypothetical protein